MDINKFISSGKEALKKVTTGAQFLQQGKEYMTNLWEKISNSLDSVWERVNALINSKENLGELGKKIEAKVQNVVQKVVNRENLPGEFLAQTEPLPAEKVAQLKQIAEQFQAEGKQVDDCRYAINEIQEAAGMTEKTQWQGITGKDADSKYLYHETDITQHDVQPGDRVLMRTSGSPTGLHDVLLLEDLGAGKWLIAQQSSKKKGIEVTARQIDLIGQYRRTIG